MASEGNLKICLAASAGGHLTQLLRLEPAWRGHDLFFVTTGSMVCEELRERYGSRVYAVGESNHRHPWRLLMVLARCARIVLKERPDVVISTGAAHGCLLCFLGRLTGARVVWVDSIANVERPSLSGRLVMGIAGLFIVQWPEVALRYHRASYYGQLL